MWGRVNTLQLSLQKPHGTNHLIRVRTFVCSFPENDWHKVIVVIILFVTLSSCDAFPLLAACTHFPFFVALSLILWQIVLSFFTSHHQILCHFHICTLCNLIPSTCKPSLIHGFFLKCYRICGWSMI